MLHDDSGIIGHRVDNTTHTIVQYLLVASLCCHRPSLSWPSPSVTIILVVIEEKEAEE
jgi:hypothetical protein